MPTLNYDPYGTSASQEHSEIYISPPGELRAIHTRDALQRDKGAFRRIASKIRDEAHRAEGEGAYDRLMRIADECDAEAKRCLPKP